MSPGPHALCIGIAAAASPETDPSLGAAPD